MKKLFDIVAVYNEEIIFEKKQVGTTESNAVFKSGVYGKLNEMGVEDLDDVDIIINAIGYVKKKKVNAPKLNIGKCSHDCSSCGSCK